MSRIVLIVEDNPRNRKLLRTILRFRGFDVVECEDGTASLELAKKHRPVLILMDIELPTMDGITALGLLRGDSATRNIPVIAVTASVTPSEREKVASAGFDGYVAKPIDVEKFGELVDRMAGKERQA